MRAGKLRDVILRIRSSGAIEGDALSVTLGDAAAQVAKNGGDNRFQLSLDRRSIKQGVNVIKLTIARRGAAAKAKATAETSGA